MPYDPRPTSEGGNRGIDQEFSRQAPRGLYRVIGVDTFDGGDWVEDDFKSPKEAVDRADEKAGQMTKMYVYNDKGRCIHSAGDF